MRKLFFIPVMAGIIALSATQAFAQSATVVMRNGDRVQAEVLDMGRTPQDWPGDTPIPPKQPVRASSR